MSLNQIASFRQCVCDEERRQRFGVTLVNLLLWLLIVVAVAATLGGLLILVLFSWIIRSIVSEYQVRKLQALGATVSAGQLPQVHEAALEVCRRFDVKHMPRIIVISSGETNAFAVRFARKRIVLMLSELLEGIIDDPGQLRALLAHEICHIVMDYGGRGTFEIYKPARYKAARELTCDNAGLAAAGDLTSGKDLIKKLCVGNKLHDRLAEPALIDEARTIYSGLIGWFVRRHLSHPPAGARLANLEEFVNEA